MMSSYKIEIGNELPRDLASPSELCSKQQQAGHRLSKETSKVRVCGLKHLTRDQIILLDQKALFERGASNFDKNVDKLIAATLDLAFGAKDGLHLSDISFELNLAERPLRHTRTLSFDRLSFSYGSPIKAAFESACVGAGFAPYRYALCLGLEYIEFTLDELLGDFVRDDITPTLAANLPDEPFLKVLNMLTSVDAMLRSSKELQALKHASRAHTEAGNSYCDMQIVSYPEMVESYSPQVNCDVAVAHIEAIVAPYNRLGIRNSAIMMKVITAHLLGMNLAMIKILWSYLKWFYYDPENGLAPYPFVWHRVAEYCQLSVDDDWREPLPLCVGAVITDVQAWMSGKALNLWAGHALATGDYTPVLMCDLPPAIQRDAITATYVRMPISGAKGYVWVSSNTPLASDGLDLWNTIQYFLVIALGPGYFIVAPWFMNMQSERSDGKVVVKVRSPDTKQWIVLMSVALASLPGASAATPVAMDVKSSVATGATAFLCFLFFQVLCRYFPKLRKIVRAVMDDESERSVESGFSRPRKKFQGAPREHPIPTLNVDNMEEWHEAETNPPPLPPIAEEEPEETTNVWHSRKERNSMLNKNSFWPLRRSLLFKRLAVASEMNKLRGLAVKPHCHQTEKPGFLRDERAVIHSRIDDDKDFREWIIGEIAEGTLSSQWVRSDMMIFVAQHRANTYMAPVIETSSVKLAKVMRSGGQRVVLSMSQAIAPTPVGLQFSPHMKTLAEVSKHPVFDLLLCAQRAMLTPWMSGTTAASRVSVAVDFGVIIYRLYDVIPKSRTAILAAALKTLCPTLRFQDDSTPAEKNTEGWLSFVNTFDVDWKTASDRVKWLASKSLAFVALVPTLWNPLCDGESFTDSIQNVAKDLKKHKHVETLIDAVFGVVEGGFNLLMYGKLGSPFGSPFKDVETKYSDLRRMAADFIMNGETDCDDIINEVITLRDSYTALRAKVQSLPEQRHCTDRVMALDLVRKDLYAYQDSQGTGYAPRALGLTGGAGLGKSTAMCALADIWMWAIGLTPRIGYILEDDKFDSKLDPSHNVGFIEDVGKTTEKFLEKPAGQSLIRFCTSTPVPLIKADVEDKKCQFSHLKQIVYSGNELGARLNIGATHPAAVARRALEFAVTPNLDKGYWDVDTNTFRPNVAQAVKEPTHLHFQRVKHLDDPKEEKSWRPHVTGPLMNWDELQALLVQMAKHHHEEQMSILNAKTVSRVRCCHSRYKANCTECASVEFQGFKCQKKAALYANKALIDFVSEWCTGLTSLSEDELYSRAFYDVVLICACSAIVAFHLCFMSSSHPVVFVLTYLMRCIVDLVCAVGAVQRKQQVVLTREEFMETAETNASYRNTYIIGGLSAGVCLACLSYARTLVFQGALSELSAEEKAIVDELTDKAAEAKEGTPVKVEVLKEIIRHEDLVAENYKERFKDNYWNPVQRIDPVSMKGSGASDESVAETIRNNTYYLVERTGALHRRIVTQLESGKFLMNAHYLEGLEHGKLYEMKRKFDDGYMFVQTFKFDLGSVVRDGEGGDYCILRTPNVRGGCKALIDYFPDNLSASFDNEGIQLVPKSDWNIGIEKVSVSIHPSSTVAVDDVILKGIYRVTTVTPSMPGWCGGLVIVNKTVMGIHSFGTHTPSLRGGGGSLLVKPHMRAALRVAGPKSGSDEGPKLDYRSVVPKLSPEHQKNPSNFVGLGNVATYGHFERNFSLRTSLCQNEYAKDLGDWLGMKLENTYAPARGSFNEVAHTVLTIGSAYKGEGLFSEYRAATDKYLEGHKEVITKTLEENKWLAREPIGITAATFGLKGNPYENGVDPQKSAGKPFDCKKGDWIEEVDYDTRTGVLNSRLEHDLLDVIFFLKTGKCTGLLGNALGKDEPLPWKEVDRLGHVMTVLKEKRGFVGCCMLMQIVVKMYIGPILDVMQRANHFFGNAVGIDPGSSEWSDLIDHMSRDVDVEHPRFFSIDHVKYDLTHHEALDESLTNVVVSVGRCMEYNEQELDIVSILMQEQQQMYVVFAGPIMKSRIWPSGILPTAIGGATKSILQLVTGLYRQIPQDTPIRSYINFTALGDDNMSGVRRNQEMFDIAKLREFYEETGMGITAGDKEGEITFTPLSDSTFLSRTTWFHPDLERYVGKLKMSSITRPLVVRKKSAKIGEYMTDVCASIARESALHGKETYEQFQQAFVKLFVKMQYPIPYSAECPYQDYIVMMQERDATKDRRRVFQGGIEESSEVKDTQEVRHIDEPGEMEVMDESTKYEGSAYRVPLGTRSLPPFMEREVRGLTYVLEKDVQFQQSISPLSIIMGSFRMKERLQTFTALNCDIVVRFAITGTKFHYCSFVAHNVYRPLLLDFQDDRRLPHDLRMLLASQRSPLYFELGDNEVVAELRIPFFWPDAYMQITRFNVDDYCRVNIESVTPPRCAVDDTSSDPTLTVYVRLDNPKVLGHTPRLFHGVAPEEGKPKPSAMLGRAARMADAMARVPGLTLPAEIASGVLHGASDLARAAGYSKPINYGGSGYVPFVASSTACANTDHVGRVLAYDVHQGVALDPNIGPYIMNEELAIKHLVSMPNLIKTGFIRFETEGAEFLKINVTPAIELINGKLALLSSQGLVSSFRKFWHGDMCYRITFKTTGLTGGKVAASYNADGDESTRDFEVLDSYTLDLKSSHVMEIRVHWMTYRNWLYTFKSDLPNVFGSYDNECHNGHLSFWISQRLVGTSPDQTVDFYVEAWMENEMFMNPDYCYLANRSLAEQTTEGFVSVDTVFAESEFVEAYGDPIPVTFPLNTAAPTPIIGEEEETAAPSASPFPPSNAPSLRPSALPVTPGPTREPTTERPTSAPSGKPSASPSAKPSFMATLFPTKTPVCTAVLQEVPFEWMAARSGILPDPGGILITRGTKSMRPSILGDPSISTYASFTAPVGVVTATNANSTILITGEVRIRSGNTQPQVARQSADFEFSDNVVVDKFYAHLPEDMYVREIGPAEMLEMVESLGGTGELIELNVNGVPLSCVLVLTPPTSYFVPQASAGICNTGSSSGTVTFRGSIEKVSGRINASVGTYFSDPWDEGFKPLARTVLFSMTVLEVKAAFQGAEEEQSMFVIGKPLGQDTTMIQVHAGEDIISLRQDLKILRPSARVLVSSPATFKSHLHFHPRKVLSPFLLLQHCYGAARGGMVAWYRMDGDGYMMVQRGTSCLPQDNVRFSRGYEFADTRVNPSIITMFPWYSPTRFDYARGAFVGSNSTYRDVYIKPRGGSVTLTEDLSIAEDFSFFLFMGAPVLQRP